MRTDREVMQQAVEALELSIDDVRDCLNNNLPLAGYARYDRRIEAYKEQITKHEEAITALRQALEQADEPVACPYCKDSHTLGAVYFDQNCFGCVKRMGQYQRWVGLTLKDMPDNKFGRPEWLEGVNWAEAKLKEKNT